ncbi:protein canopy-1 [Lepisosteus oculatus]|uniref:Canopy FGF signaling regulator 1 n=1 Tax=Lepisosteus oculatus TaxID=7918 RepID=W5N426_LEPOC|nr:PREDICTED: protein canopy homolog 1 [Lepisosteus oculatus]XP_015210112.1 PREDICTED: protein canopy homolog 1 [Lepisosteus oculatus]
MALSLIRRSILLALISVVSETIEGKKDEVLYCSACRAVVDELNYSIKKVDPKRTIHVGSFRLNPDGSLKDKKVPLARSETHLTELLEDVCNNMSDYALYVDPDTKEKRYKRFAPRDDDKSGFGDFQNFQFGEGPEASNSLKFACESVVEEYEDDIISLFAQEADHVADKLCSEVSGLCKGVPVSRGEL